MAHGQHRLDTVHPERDIEHPAGHVVAGQYRVVEHQPGDAHDDQAPPDRPVVELLPPAPAVELRMLLERRRSSPDGAKNPFTSTHWKTSVSGPSREPGKALPVDLGQHVEDVGGKSGHHHQPGDAVDLQGAAVAAKKAGQAASPGCLEVHPGDAGDRQDHEDERPAPGATAGAPVKIASGGCVLSHDRISPSSWRQTRAATTERYRAGRSRTPRPPGST